MDIINFYIFKLLNNVKKLKMTDLNELGINVALLLAAGKSTRFKDHVPKQLYRIKDIPIIQYSINVLINYVDKLLIVTNTECYQSILEIVKTYNSNNFIIIINDKNCRLESIISCLNYINKNCDPVGYKKTSNEWNGIGI